MILLKTFQAVVRLAASAFFGKSRFLKSVKLEKVCVCVFLNIYFFESAQNYDIENLPAFLVNFHTGSSQNYTPMLKLLSLA